MTLEEAQAIYRELTRSNVPYVVVSDSGTDVCLDGDFEAKDLEALVIIMRRLQVQL